MTRLSPRPCKKPSKKHIRHDAEQLILLAAKSRDKVEEAFKVVALHCGSVLAVKEQITVDKADDDKPEDTKISRFTIFLSGNKVWEGWFERYLKEEETKTNSNKTSKELVTYATWQEQWFPLPEPKEEKEQDKKLPGTIDSEDLNKRI